MMNKVSVFLLFFHYYSFLNLFIVAQKVLNISNNIFNIVTTCTSCVQFYIKTVKCV